MRLRFLVACVTVYVTLGANFVSAQVTNCPFNVDGVAAATDALRDGVVLTRYARGMRGADLVAGTGLTNSAGVESTILANLSRLDMDGDRAFGEVDAAAIARVLFGYNTAVASAVPPSVYATRDSAAAIKAYLDGGCSSTSLAEQQNASTFLMQATFGASLADINAFNALAGSGATTDRPSKRRARTWVENQFNTARTGLSHYDYVVDYAANVCIAPDCNGFGSEVTRFSFWRQAVTSPDQLRQRLIYALSQIVVVSSFGESNNPYELSAYLDMLGTNAFGNFRDLLAGVVRAPAMGRYLNHLRNDGRSTTPNENFAREVLQLFAVGLFRLNPDGTNAAGNPPAYTEDIVKGFARSFTGMSFDDIRTNLRCIDNPTETLPSWYWSPDSRCYPESDTTPIGDNAGWRRPMKTYDGFHSAAARQLLQYDASNPGSADPRCAASNITPYQNIASIPTEAALSRTKVSKATADIMINRAIDNIFCHPNVGPFIGKQLIRFFVTSTPSNAYVSRVTSAFNNNGAGVRGDMKAVMRAILLDDEALHPDALALANRHKFGKLREPLLRVAGLMRAFPRPALPANSGRFFIDGLDSVEYGINQSPLQSPTVFNFYHPEFSPPGPVQQSGAVGPEFEITTTTSIAATQNFFGDVVSRNTPDGSVPRQNGWMYNNYLAKCDPYDSPPVYTDCIFMNYGDLYGFVDNTSALFDYINLVLMTGKLPASVKANYVTALDSAYSTNYSGLDATALANRKRDRVKAALWMAVHSPEFQVQY